MFSKTLRVGALACAGLLCGCAGTQLQYNTLDVASTLADLETRQVLENLSRTIDEPYAIPSQVDIITGTVATTNSVTPSVTAPLSRAAARSSGGGITGYTTAAFGASVSASDSWNQSWVVTPISDPVALANIAGLYHYIIYGINDKNSPPAAALALQPKKIFWSGFAADGSSNPPPEGVPVRALGRFGNHNLYISECDFNDGYLSKIVLLVLPRSAGDSSGSLKTKSSKQAGRGKRLAPNVGSVRPIEKKPAIFVAPVVGQ